MPVSCSLDACLVLTLPLVKPGFDPAKLVAAVPPATVLGSGFTGVPWTAVVLLLLFFYGWAPTQRWIAVLRNARAKPGSPERLTAEQADALPRPASIATPAEALPPPTTSPTRAPGLRPADGQPGTDQDADAA